MNLVLSNEVDKSFRAQELSVHRWGVVNEALLIADTEWKRRFYTNLSRSLEKHKNAALHPYPVFEFSKGVVL